MQGFFAPSCGPAMQAFSLTFMRPSLRVRDLVLNVAVEVPCLQFIAITGGRGLS